MLLTTWNPQSAFRQKAHAILKYKPDILIVPESEHPDKLLFADGIPKPTSSIWHGNNLHKGIGIYAYSHYTFELLPEFDPVFRYVLPLRVTGGRNAFTLLAVWAMHIKGNYAARYIGQVWGAIQHYAHLLSGPIIIAGDFNSNKIWDRKKRIGNHSDVVRKLEEHNIYSAYHRFFNEEQGLESRPTFYLQRKQHKPYHIDYCFASADLINKIQNVSIGTYADWIGYSDHVPMMVEFGGTNNLQRVQAKH